MNRADVALLDSQLDELGNTFLRNRQLQQEGQLRGREIDVNNAFRQAQMQHYNAMEEHYGAMQQKESERNDILEKQIGLRQSAQDLAEAQSSLKESVGALAQQVKAGKMSQDEATQYFKDAMDNGIGKSNPALHDQMLAQPQYKAMYDGNMDWATVADQMAAQSKNRSVTGADEHLINSANALKAEADSETDPQKKAALQQQIDQLNGVIQKRSGQVAPPDYTQTTVKPSPFGGAPSTNTVSRAYSRPGAVGTPAAPPAAMPQVPTVPPDPGQRVVGQRYRSATNPNLIGTWTGQGFDTNAAPTQAVAGFGNAQGSP